jgi:hypothetical protein
MNLGDRELETCNRAVETRQFVKAGQVAVYQFSYRGFSNIAGFTAQRLLVI